MTGSSSRVRAAAFVWLGVASAGLLSASEAGACSGERPGKGPIARAVFAEQRLWVLDEEGSLSYVAPGGKARVPSGLPAKVLDVCSTGEHLRVLLCANDMCNRWMLASAEDGRWRDGPIVSSEGESAGSLSCAAGASVLVTRNRSIEFAGDEVTERALSQPVDPRGASMLVSGPSILIGGGGDEFAAPGLRLIDRVTGGVSLLDDSEQEDSYGRAGCGGFLNPNCASVGDLVEEPWQPGCSLVAVGRTALVQSQIWEVCQGRVRRGFATILTAPNHAPPEGAPLAAVNFSTLVRSGNDVWSESFAEGLFRFSGSATPKFVPFPHFQRVDDLWVSFELPGLALLEPLRDEAAVSLSSPLLVPRG